MTRLHSLPLAAFLLLLVAVLGYLNFLFFVHFDFTTAVSGDSISYLHYSPIRTAGYPLFLDLLKAWPYFPGNVAVIQLNLLVGATAFFCWSLNVVLPRWAPHVLFALLGVHVTFFSQSLLLLTESLFASLVMLHVTCVLRFLQRRSATRWLWGVGGSAVAAILVRPVGYFLLVSMVYLIVAMRSDFRLKQIMALCLPVAAGLLIASTVNLLKYDVFATQAFGGYSLVGHLAWAIRGDPASVYPELSASIERQLAPIYAERPQMLGFPLAYQRYTSQEFNRAAWRVVVPAIEEYVTRRDGEASPQAINDVATTLATEALRRDPGGYLYHVLAHHMGLWYMLGYAPEPVTQRMRNIAIVSGERLELQGLLGAGFQERLPVENAPPGERLLTAGRFIWGIIGVSSRVLATLLFCLAVIWPILALRQPDTRTLWIGYLGVCMLANFGLVSMVQVALPRYALVVMPLGLALLVLSGLAGGDFLRWLNRIRRA